MSRQTRGVRSGAARFALVATLAVVSIALGPLVTRVEAAGRVAPKVVLIVGPAGSATPYYRRLADEAADAAAAFTSRVVKVYSPNATWGNVKAALRGASVVVYLGHGNGWPSIYRSALYPLTQDGFGLNPREGAADSHQYFGEQQIGDEIRLAPNAVVVFSHLCYASGNTEPGLAEGTPAEAQQRVDNYAAGFFRAGAAAVIADAYLAPAYYVTAVLRGADRLDAIWREAPDRHDHLLRFASQRTKGAIAEMDPDAIDAGFHRSIVVKASLTSRQVLGDAVAGSDAAAAVPEPTLAGLGLTFDAPTLAKTPTAGSRTRLTLPVPKASADLLPTKVMIGTRWDRLDGATASDASVQAASSSDATASPDAAPSAGPSAAPSPSGDPGTTAVADAADDLVIPEQVGELVTPVAARRLATGGLSIPIRIPPTPGLYRLVTTIHQADGVAYDAATQALIPALVIRVTGPITAAYAAPAAMAAATGARFDLAVRVTNLGTRPWGRAAVTPSLGAAEREPPVRATIVARWVQLGDATTGPASPIATATSILPAGLAPGASAEVVFAMTAPTSSGQYLVILDVVDSGIGSLAAAGVPPGIVRVTVGG